MWDIDNFDGLPVVVAQTVPPPPAAGVEDNIFVLHPGTASADAMIWSGGRPRNITKIPGRRAVVAEIQQTDGANLFILTIL